MHPVALAALSAAGDPSFNPNATVTNFRALLLGVIAVILLVVTVIGLLVARKGNPGKNASIVASVLIALVPMAIAVGVGAAAFGAAFLGWAVPGISK